MSSVNTTCVSHSGEREREMFYLTRYSTPQRGVRSLKMAVQRERKGLQECWKLAVQTPVSSASSRTRRSSFVVYDDFVLCYRHSILHVIIIIIIIISIIKKKLIII